MKTQYNKFEELIDFTIESLFLADMIFCFFNEFKDSETYELVDHFKPIAINYIKKSFVFDLIAWIPFESLANLSSKNMNNQLLRCLKILRLRRLIDLMNVEKFKGLLYKYH